MNCDARLVSKPFQITELEVLLREMIMEGILSISKGENPRIIEEKLNSYVPPKDRVVSD